jgi:type I restriction enzyme, S subunit
MEAEQFLSNFGLFANAPLGVSRLRQMIYHLATTGLLLASTGHEADADFLLSEISSKREQLIREKHYKRILELEGETIRIPDRVVLPNSWRWTRLLDIGEINPRNEAEDDQPAAFLPMSGVSQLHGGKILPELRRWEEIKKGFTHFANGDVAVAKITPCFENGKSAVISDLPCTAGIGAGTTELHVFRPIHPGILPKYVYLYLRSPLFMSEGEQNMTGTAGQKRLPTSYFATRAFPLPPTEEQERIGAKVDELMALCDKLEAQQQDRRKVQTNLRQSLLQTLHQTFSSFELSSVWSRFNSAFDCLFDNAEDVDDFLSELKNMAVRGLLALPSGGKPQVEKIKRSCSELRQRYIASSLMRRQKMISTVNTEGIFPSHWSVLPFDDVAVVIGGVTKGRNLQGLDVVTCPYLAVANVQRGFFKLKGLKTIQIAKQELDKYLVHEGDLLITEGGDWDKVGRTAIWRGGIENCLHQNHIFKARVPSEYLMNEWVELVFNSGVGRDFFADASKQTTNLASINMTQLRSFPLPIPPLDEQQTVIARLNALTATCQNWKKQLQKKQEIAALYADSTVSSLAGTSHALEEDEPVKMPQTKLIATLRTGATPSVKAHAPLATILSHSEGEMSAHDLWQRYGTDDIEAFYAQLKTEVAHGWIQEPSVAEMRELVPATES